MRAKAKSVLAFGTMIGLVYAGSAHAQATSGGAQAAPPPADPTPSDIIVTARRIEERLQDVPISITVLSQKQIENYNVVNAQDLATFTPAVSTNPGFGSANSSFSIRGFVQATNTAPSVGVYFADTVAPRGASSNILAGDGAGPGSYFDLQNVQVLKGPQGTLFGRNTTGGAILLVPQKPTGKFEGYAEVSAGNYGMERVQAVVNVPISDNARFRIGVDHETRDGYLKNDTGIGPTRFDDVNYTAVRASLVLNLTPDLENYTIGTFTRSSTVGDIQKTIACDPTYSLGPLACAQLAREAAKGADFYTVQNTQADPRTLLQQWQAINTTTWHASDTITVKNIISYAQLRLSLRSPIFGTDLDLSPYGYPAGTYVDFATSNPIANGHTAAQSTFTDEFRVAGDALNGKFTWQTGVYVEISDPLGISGSQSPVLLQCSNPDTFTCNNPLGVGTINYAAAETTFHDFGVYAQGTYSLTDQLKLTGGIRYTQDSQTVNGTLITYAFPSPFVPGGSITPECTNTTQTYPACSVNYTQKSHAPTWLIDLDYKPTEDVLFYAKWARGYRAGGVAYASPPVTATFQPEKVDTYEGGMKFTARGPLRPTLNIAAYYNNFRNQQLALGLLSADGTQAPMSGILNAGKSRIYGSEVEASITPFTGFSLNASYAYVNTKIQAVIIPDLGGSRYVLAPGQIAAGNPLPYTPKNQYTITGAYVLPIEKDIGRVTFSTTFVHIDQAPISYDHTLYDMPASLNFTPARNLLSLNLSWDAIAGSAFDAQFFMTNVTGSKYYTYSGDLVSGTGFETAMIGEPRMFGGRLKFHFGR